MTDSDDLRQVERARCAAIVHNDLEGLSSLLSEALVHIHATGYADDKVSYLEGLRSRLDVRSVTRGDLTLRNFGSTTVMTGVLENIVRRRGEERWQSLRSLVTQVWEQTPGSWKLVSYHACPCAEAGR